MPEHISRKELKQDRIHDAIEHSAEAVYSHKQVALVVVLVVGVIAAGYGVWSVYIDRRTASASAAFDTAMKAYTGHVGAADPAEPGEASYSDEDLERLIRAKGVDARLRAADPGAGSASEAS